MWHSLGISPVLMSLYIFLSIISQTRVGEAYSNVSCLESERKALLQFRQSLIDSTSNRLSSWTGEDCCTWEGIGCSKSTGHVVKLDLHNPLWFDEGEYDLNPQYYYANFSNNCLKGRLNPSLINLTHLQYLDLSLNNFSEPKIPAFLGLLKDLRYLNLSDAGFGGEVPHQLGNLSSLQYLDLGFADVFFANDLRNSLTIENLWWVARLSSLEGLYLAYQIVRDADWLSAINMLPSLTTLELDHCHLPNPTIPYLSYVNLTSLTSLDLSGHQFHSTIPLWIFNLTGIQKLVLRANFLQGPIPDAFQQMTSLVYLDLYYNQMDSSALKSLCNMSSLAYLQLAQNALQGSIPSEIGHLKQLKVLDLSYNSLIGSIPSGLGHLEQLTSLVLSNNELTGSVPRGLGKLKKLQVLDISTNSITGVLSELHFLKLKELKSLITYNNDLTLNFSSSWVPPFQLQYINMGFMEIGPRFPIWLRNQKELQELYLMGTGISDTIPNWFRVICYNITMLDLSHNNIIGNPLEFRQTHYGPRQIYLNANKLEGSLNSFPIDIIELNLSDNILTGHVPIPDGDTTFVAMEYLELQNNRLTGSIPKEFCNMNSLTNLDLSNNQLSGRVPSCLGNLRELTELNLANNSLFGEIPGSLGNLENLVSLHMSRNKFIGRLRFFRQNWKSLKILDLGENGLKDIIPPWIGEKSLDLMFLSLQSNNFHGGIPHQLCQLSNLQVLNLAENNLTGSIPHCFSNFSMMENDSPGELFTRDDTSSRLSIYTKGRELEYSSNLLLVKAISLSENNLVGEIPEEIMDLAGLQSLNLSKNHLSGRIPNKIGNLKHIESLDLSMNELVGGIPQSLSALDSLNHLNMSFNKLSGRIPSGNQLQTLDDPSIYKGNSGLCGKPLLNICPEDKPPVDNTPVPHDKSQDESDFQWFYAGIGPGFGIGLAGVLCILRFKKSWRYAYFKFVEDAYNRMWVIIALMASRLRRKFAASNSAEET